MVLKLGSLETYVLCSPVSFLDQPVESIGAGEEEDVSIPVPNAYLKSVLAETRGGALQMWSFMIPNEAVEGAPEDYRVSTDRVEQFTGIQLWCEPRGSLITRKKRQVKAIW